MSDERKQEMQEIMAEEFDTDCWGTAREIRENDPKGQLSRQALRAIDRIAALPPKPLEGRKERVEEVKKIILASVWFTSCGWVYTGEAKVFAEQIVATEPQAPEKSNGQTLSLLHSLRQEFGDKHFKSFLQDTIHNALSVCDNDRHNSAVMSREEMVEVVACYLKSRSAHDIACDIRQTPLHNAPWAGQPGRLECWVRGIHYAIDALADKIPASNEVEVWERKYWKLGEHLFDIVRKDNRKIDELNCKIDELTRQPPPPAEGLDKPSDRRRELDKLAREINDRGKYPALRKLAEKELKATE